MEIRDDGATMRDRIYSRRMLVRGVANRQAAVNAGGWKLGQPLKPERWGLRLAGYHSREIGPGEFEVTLDYMRVPAPVGPQ